MLFAFFVMKRIKQIALAAAVTVGLCGNFTAYGEGGGEPVAVMIVIGQSNADGSAFANDSIDSEMRRWYESPQNPRTMRIWYRSTVVENQPPDENGESMRHAVDGKIEDAAPGWMELWYRNENRSGRTAMNMIHGYGTYSEGTGPDCAQGRRGMEGAFGRRFATVYPDVPLYIIKLGVSGSSIKTWTDDGADVNWRYFYDKMYRPAIASLLAAGKEPRLAGIWWMQGCGDGFNPQSYYEPRLRKLIDRCRDSLGFESPHIYIGHILAPGESAKYPAGSVQYGPGVRAAQDAVAASTDGVETVDVSDVSFQYEDPFKGYLHFSHEGVNRIADKLFERIEVEGPEGWSCFKGLVVF